MEIVGPLSLRQRPHYPEELSKGEGNRAGTGLLRDHEILSAKVA